MLLAVLSEKISQPADRIGKIILSPGDLHLLNKDPRLPQFTETARWCRCGSYPHARSGLRGSMIQPVAYARDRQQVRLVLLTAHTPEGELQHRYVACSLAQAFKDELVGIVVATGVPRSRANKIKRWSRRYTVKEIASRIAVRLVHRATGEQARKQRQLGAVLFPNGEDGRMPRRDILKQVGSHNSEACLAIIRELKPDIVAIFGTLIIGRKLIASMPTGINVHTGISPRYRGSDTNFWPIYNEEPDFLGVTVHRLDAGVDSGAILARGRPNIAGDDDEHVIYAKAVQLGAELLCDAIRREHEGRTNPLLQKLHEGHEYRSVQRTVQAEAKVRRLLREGILGEGLSGWREEY